MNDIQSFENYPKWMVAIAVLHNFLIYGLGIYILSRVGILWAIPYVLYCLWIEFRVLKYSCKDCYYYSKLCCLGRSKLAPLFFKKGDPRNFWIKETSRLSMLPDFLVPIIPLVVGIILLIVGFSVLQLLLIILLIILYMGGNAFVRGSLACKFCKQREIRCPAEEMFSSKKSA